MSLALAALGLALLGGCVYPEPMGATVVSRYQEDLARHPQSRVDDPNSTSLLAPPVNNLMPPLKIVKDAAGTHVYLSLDETVMRALANNLDIRVVSYDPEISREEIIKAAAEFDYSLLANYNHQNNENEVNSNFGGGQQDIRSYAVGLKQKTITGATHNLAWTMTRSWDNSRFTKLFQTQWEQSLVYQVTQPLLRDAWPDFNLSKMRITQVNYKAGVAAFRQKVEETMTDVIATYWNLMQTRRELEIQKALLDQTVETFDRVQKRKDLDATEVQIKQAEAAVASRKATLINVQKAILDAQDRLARLLSDGQINLLNEYDIIPTTEPLTAPVELNVADQLLTSLRHNPVLEQARLAIDAAGINVKMAENQELPRLDLVGSAGVQGLETEWVRANNTMRGGNYASYSFGIQAELPIGNRARRADTAQKRFAQLKSVAQMQTTADQVAALVKERIRQVRATYEQMQAQLLVVAASKAQLRALEETEKTRGKLTPEFLTLKLQAQEGVAESERAHIQAVSSYNATMVDLARATGTVLEIHNIQIALPAIIEQRNWPGEMTPAATTSSPNWPPPTDQPAQSGSEPAGSPGAGSAPATTPEDATVPATGSASQ